MYLKYFSFISLLFTIDVYADAPEETKLDLDVIRTLVKIGYEADRLLVISDITEKALGGNTDNITIVGTQDIMNKDGSFKEIRTVALHLPTDRKPNKIEEIKNDDESDDDGLKDFAELRKTVDLLKKIGLPIEAAYREFDADGKITEAGYVAKDSEFIMYDGIAYHNKTIRVSSEQAAEEKVKSLQGGILPVAVLKFDAEGNFLENESSPATQLYVAVEDQENTDPKTLKTILDIVGKVGVKNMNNLKSIPKELVTELEKAFPTHAFLVTSNSDGEYLSKDFAVRANFYLPETENTDGGLMYNIYGLLKETVK